MIKIEECGEPLVDLKKICPELIIRLGKKNEIAYVRQTIALKIKKALSFLPKGTTFIIRSAWRSPKTQEETFKSFVRKAKKNFPKASNKQIIRIAQKYVAPFKGKYTSGHLTGGAIDLRLFKNGRKVPMNSKKLSYSQNALSNQPKLPWYLRRNREIMFSALNKVGLSNYPKEFWHWSYGDIQWAKRTGQKRAIYGVILKLQSV